MIETTDFPDVEAAVIVAARELIAGVLITNKVPPTITGKLVTVGYSGGGFRDWGEAAVNIGVNVYVESDDDAPGVSGCRTFTRTVQDAFATISNDLIEHITVSAGGGTSVPRQTPPFQRYFPATVYLRGQARED